MKFFRQAFQVCMQNFRKWTSDYRIWTVGILLIILIHENISNLAAIGDKLGVKSTLWYFPFLYCQYHIKIIFTLPILMVFCNAPFVDKNTVFILARSGKKQWLTGQILYIIFSAAVYYIFIFLCTVILSLPYAEITLDWGKLINTLAYTNTAASMGYHFIDVSGFVLTYFTPFQAVWFTFLLSWLTAILFGMIICFFNVITGTKYVGTAVSGILIVFSGFVAAYEKSGLFIFSPASWNTLNNIDVGGLTNHPNFYYCITVCIAVSLVLAVFCFIKKKNDNLFV